MIKIAKNSLFFSIDARKARRYIVHVISPDASAAGREAGSNGSASAFSRRAA
jgi:hypothetical protein